MHPYCVYRCLLAVRNGADRKMRKYFRLHVKVKNVGDLVARFVKLKLKVPDYILKEDEYNYEEKEVIENFGYRVIDLDNTIQDIVETEQVPMGN